jgi:hypothetical protein
MPRRTSLLEDWGDGDNPDDQNEDVDYSEDEDDDDDLCFPCPHCGRRILEESERCPYCEKYLSKEDAPPARKPLWIWFGVAACLYVVYRWIVW